MDNDSIRRALVTEEAAVAATEVGTGGDGHPVSAVIGKVASPPRREATSEQFHFWVPSGQLVEKTQIVRTESQVGNQLVRFYALVNEVYRQSRKRDISEEYDTFDGDVGYEPQFKPEGVTFATASILRTQPPVLTPPLEQSPVILGGEAEVRLAYGADEIANPLAVGLVKNGAGAVAGPGFIDLDYLLGVNGGHMNVNGVAGRGTKSSFLLFVIGMLLKEARRRAEERPSDSNPLMVVPIILNVKGFDLFFIDQWNRNFVRDRHLGDWQALGVDDPGPFQHVSFFAPQMPGGTIAVPTGGSGAAHPYSWSLSDVIERGLFVYLFADEDTSDANFSALVLDVEAWLTNERTEHDGTATRRLRHAEGVPTTFQGLLDWMTSQAHQQDNQRTLPGHHGGTWTKLRRRLLKLVLEGNGVLRREDQHGHPLDLVTRSTRDPVVVDLYSLIRIPSLQRFVVATILRQLMDDRTGPMAVNGLVYLVALDELNRFAPRGAGDPITQLLETVAAEMRSQGIILLGAQQQASKVSEKVIENAAIRVLGRSGSLEMTQSIWHFLSDSARRKAATLAIDEKMVIQDNFREPMHVRVPFPAWAMRRGEARNDPAADTRPDNAAEEIATY
jgi:DNA helicase HerA-like ATPase